MTEQTDEDRHEMLKRMRASEGNDPLLIATRLMEFPNSGTTIDARCLAREVDRLTRELAKARRTIQKFIVDEEAGPPPEKNPGQPKFAQAGRVFTQGTDQGGRVQQVTYDAAEKAFRYMVKWDNGPTTPHLEGELQHAPLPPHYP